MKKILRLSLIFFLGSAILILLYASPILKSFPSLTGSYNVGVQTLYPVNQDRSYALHIFYPADIKNAAQKLPYLGNKMSHFQDLYAQHLGVPRPITQLLFRGITTHAYLNVPLCGEKKQYPILLFSHGLLGLPSDMYGALLQDVASHGYIVVGIDHPNFNILTLRSDGTLVTSHALSQQFAKMTSAEQQDFQKNAIETYKADMSFVADYLALLNQDQKSIFYHRLDLDALGVMGHSAGGTAAIEFCRVDKRCKAAVNMDGWYDHVIGNAPLEKPLLLLFGSHSVEVAEPSPEYLKRKNLTRDEYFARERGIEEHRKKLCSGNDCSMVVLPGVAHEDFSDKILFKWPLRGRCEADTYATIAAINSHVIQFFDRYLRDNEKK